jgi:hypothetical protein
MKARGVRLLLAVSLFVIWTAWLIYLTITTSRPIVLSRPQFLVSQLDVIALLEKPAGNSTQITVKEVCWPQSEKKLVGKTITVEGLARCQGFDSPGDYILPLTREGAAYRVTPLPRSPGFLGSMARPRIYPVTRQTRWQLTQIARPTK